MKKVLFVLALVAAYGVSLAMTNAPVVTTDSPTIVVADVYDNVEKEDAKAKKEAKSEAKGCTGEKSTKSEGCAGEKSAKSGKCCDSKKSAEAKTSGGCGGK